MSDKPFGFSKPGDDDDENSSSRGNSGSGDSGGPENPFAAFGFGGNQQFDPNQPFDASQLGSMLSQIGEMISGMGSGFTGANPTGEAVNYTVAQQLARQQIGKHSPVSAAERKAAVDAVGLVELWLNETTALPAGVTTTEAWTPVEWLEKSMPTFKRLCDPVAQQLSTGLVTAMPDDAKQMLGPMLTILTQMSGTSFGSQLGQGLGHLAKEVLTGTDLGIPLAPTGTAVLMPAAIAEFSEGLEISRQDIQVFLAAREAAHVRLFSHVPWLRQRLLATVEQYARGIRMDFSEIQQSAQELDPMELMSDPSKLQELMGDGTAFEPQTTPEQLAALERLETMLALIEGWVETVVGQALSDRIPSVGALTETMRRRRASGGPAEQTFAALVGLELRPRKLREAATLWRRLAETAPHVGQEDPLTFRDSVWDHPDLLPDAADLDNPAAYIDRRLDNGRSDLDPIAELERLANEGFVAPSEDDADRQPGRDDEDPDNKA